MTSRGINYWQSEDGKDKPAAVLDQQLPAGDRCPHRASPFPPSASTGSSICAPSSLRGDKMGWNNNSPGKVWKNLLILGSTTGRRPSSPRPATSAPTTSSPARECGSSTPCRGPASSATRPGRRTPTSTSAAPTTGARCRSMTSAASSTFPPGRRPTISTAPTASVQNLFANCLLALDARTGKRLWHFQTVHHDSVGSRQRVGAAARDRPAQRPSR